jgi:ribose transport system ATP-binding protein
MNTAVQPELQRGAATAAEPLMQLEGLAKAYGPITVLSGVDLDIRASEIHAIIGENGAGKSTLMRLVSGHVEPTAGTITYRGHPVHFTRPVQAEHAGIVLVHQEILLADGLTVVENLFLGRELGRNGLVDDATMERIAAERLSAIGCTASPRDLVRNLPIAQRQLGADRPRLARRAQHGDLR